MCIVRDEKNEKQEHDRAYDINKPTAHENSHFKQRREKCI